MSVRAQGFANAALGETVLARHGVGADPQQHVDAVASPLGDLGPVDAGSSPPRTPLNRRPSGGAFKLCEVMAQEPR